MFEKDYGSSAYVSEPLAGGVRLVLPCRKLGKARHFGWVLVGIGLFGLAFMGLWIGLPVSWGVDLLANGEPFGWAVIAFGALGIMGLVPALGMLLFGMTIVSDRTQCTIEVNGDQLIVSERMSFWRWKQRRNLHEVRTLRIGPALSGRGVEGASRKSEVSPPDLSQALPDLSSGGEILAIHASGDKMKPLKLAGGYPRPMLERIAQELAPRIEAGIETHEFAVPGSSADRSRAEVKIVGDQDESPGESSREAPPEVPPQPKGSTATIQRHPSGIVITCPPAGIWKGSRGLMFFAVLWNGFVGVFLVIMAAVSLGWIEAEGGDGPLWVMWLAMTPFIAVGIGVLLLALNMGRRRTSLATAGDRLFVARESIFGRKVHEWAATDLEEIGRGPSGMEVNDVPVLELQIRPRHGKKLGLLSERDDKEIAWIAAELNRALELVTGTEIPKAKRDDSGRPVLADDSRLAAYETAEGWQLDVPPRGMRAESAFMIFLGPLFVAIAVAVGFWVLWDSWGSDRWDWGNLFAASWVLIFGGSGLGAFYGGLVGARRRFLLTVTPDELVVVRKGVFGQHEFRWPADALKSVAVVDSGTKVNNRSLRQLRIHARNAPDLKLMTGHPIGDLSYTAAVLNDTLQLPSAGRSTEALARTSGDA